jgi:cysteine desulfurase/selenocysteine lyase
MPEPVSWPKIRSQFPALAGRTFLNTATYGQLPLVSKEAVAAHLDRRDHHACTDFLTWFEDVDQLRAAIGRLINASADDIAFTTSASQGLATVLAGIDWKSGDEVVTLEHEFPNHLYASMGLADVRGTACRWDQLEQAITRRTRLVMLSTVNYVTGLRPDLDSLVPSLHARGILVYLDGTQSLGALRFDCQRTQPDFFSVDAYKWMISPNGAGFLYVHPEARKWLRPSVIGWRSDYDWRSVDNLHHGAARFSEKAERYEGGMLNFPSLYGMQASLRLMEELGLAVIEERVLSLAELTRARLAAVSAEPYEPQAACLPSQIVLVRLPGHHPSAIAKELMARGVIVSARKGGLRVSAHFYNHEADIEQLAGELSDLLAKSESAARPVTAY